MLLTEAASVPKEGFFHKLSRKDEAMRHGSERFMGVQGWAAKYSSLQCGAKVTS